MTTGKLYKVGNTVYRVLEVQADRILLMNCLHAVMPKWHSASFLEEAQETGNESLPPFRREMDLNAEGLAKAHMRYSTIAGIASYNYSSNLVK